MKKVKLKPGDGYPVPRLYHRKAHGKKSARLLIKCGDCNNQFEIYYGPDGQDLEIAGVLASIRNWRKILLPLLSKSSAGPSETEIAASFARQRQATHVCRQRVQTRWRLIDVTRFKD